MSSYPASNFNMLTITHLKSHKERTLLHIIIIIIFATFCVIACCLPSGFLPLALLFIGQFLTIDYRLVDFLPMSDQRF